MRAKVPSSLAVQAPRPQLWLKSVACRQCLRAQGISHASRPHLLPGVRVRGNRHWPRLYTVDVSPTISVGTASQALPARFRSLHWALKDLGAVGSVFVDESRLQLALRSLQSEDAVTRIAVHDLTNDGGARRLAWALLADPLADEADWERVLQQSDNDRRPLFLRYEEQFSFDISNPLYRVIYAPSNFLKRYRLEFLIFESAPSSTDSASSGEAPQSAGSPLVPIFDILSSVSGRMSNIAFPAHQTIFYGEGIKGMYAVASALQRIPETELQNMVEGVVGVSWPLPDLGLVDSNIRLVNLEEAAESVSALRKSLAKSSEYDHGWRKSGLDPVVAFLRVNSKSLNELKPVFRSLIQSLIVHTEQSISSEESRTLRDVELRTIPEATRDLIRSIIAEWATSAHSELREKLENAFNSRNWRKLAWWKLLWRVDDVELILADLLQRAYLIDAEKGITWTCGRIQQAGFLSPDQPAKAEKRNSTGPQQKQRDDPLRPALPASMIRPTAYSSQAPDFNAQQSWFQQIATSRSALLQNSLKPMQAAAQTLLFKALLTTSTTSLLSGLLYVGVPTLGVYEAGAFGATGLVWSAWKLQQGWEAARKRWVDSVAEEGWSVLKALENKCRLVVATGGRPAKDEEAAENRRLTLEAVEKARLALNKLD